MHKRLRELSFIIGLFFLLVSLVLLGGYFLENGLKFSINLYTGIGFLAFGMLMMWVKRKKNN